MIWSKCPVFLSLIFCIPIFIYAQVSLATNTMVGKNQEQEGWQVEQMKGSSVDQSSSETESGGSVITAGLRPWKGQSNWRHRHHLKNVHGIVNILGWGFVLPAGAIIARNFRKFPLKCEEWYNLHTLFQSCGYIVGTVGWGIGIWLGNSSKHYTLKAHRILGIIVFTFATIQMLALWLQPKKEDGQYCRKWWEIYHHVVGYALIVLSIANIFEGISNIHSHSAEIKWRWFYVGMLLLLASTALALEMYRCIKSKHQPNITFHHDNQLYA